MPVEPLNAVVVITGASSGIGKAAALAFAARGATLVLAARRPEALEAAAAACRQGRSEAVAAPTDVTDADAVRALADLALARFGRIDVWVNNAGVGAAGRFTDTPPEAFRRVLETNFFGYVHGARAVIPIFRRQGRGVLINNASMVAELAEPYFSAYVASKHAVHGFGKSLRQELDLEGLARVHVCTVMPAAIDTPFFQHAANFTGRAMKAIPPVYPVAKVAEAIVACAEHPRRHFFVGKSARLFNLQSRLSSILTERLLARMVDRTHFYRDRPSLPSDGNLFVPVAEGTGTEGGWSLPGGFHVDDGKRHGWRAATRKGAMAAGGMALGLGTLAVALRSRSRARSQGPRTRLKHLARGLAKR